MARRYSSRPSWVGSPVQLRVSVRKSANRSFRVTRAAARFSWRSAAATRSAWPRRADESRRGSRQSRPKVSSAPIDRADASGATGRASRPKARSASCSPCLPKRRPRTSRGRAWSWPIVWIPRACSSRVITRPTPHSLSTGSGARKTASSPAGTTTNPSGLRRSEATLATNLFAARPAEAVRPVSARMRALIWRTASAASPKSAVVPVRSTKASSIETCSTSGEKAPRMPMICRETRWYFSMSTGRNTA